MGPLEGACSLAWEIGEPKSRGHMTEGTGAGDGCATCPLLLQGEFPVREDPSDVTDEDASPAPQPLASKPPGPPFRVKGDVDLFGLGLVDTGHKAGSSEDKEGRPLSKEKEKKKKKKKKGREEEEKAVKKKSKHKKSKEEEEGREHGRRRPRSQRSSVDALEAFLGGGAPSGHLRGGGDYEEL